MCVCLQSVCKRWDESARSPRVGIAGWYKLNEVFNQTWVLWESSRHSLSQSCLSSQSLMDFVRDLEVLQWVQKAVKCSDHLQSTASHCRWAWRRKLLILLGLSVSVGWTRITWLVSKCRPCFCLSTTWRSVVLLDLEDDLKTFHFL